MSGSKNMTARVNPTCSRPAVADLPSPGPARHGWPWTEGASPPADHELDRRAWPRITVVTPSYEQGQFLEETIRSVLLQGYPNLEYMVIDGGSRDESVDIIRRYAPWLAYWCSEPDRGQSHAINKGFARATGEILGWINSDDIYYPGALHEAAKGLASADIFLGGMVKVRQEADGYVEVKRSTPFQGVPIHEYRVLSRGPRHDFHFYQPSMFWTRQIWEKAGELDERYHYVMDREWCNRALAEGAVLTLSDRPMARFLLHDDSKSVALQERFSAEIVRMYLRLGRRSDFRLLTCLRAALRPAQTLLGIRAGNERSRFRRWLYRNAARSVKLVRVLLDRTRGAGGVRGANA